jgi:hypothetical protein
MLFVLPLEIALEQTQVPASWQIRTLLCFKAKIVGDNIPFQLTV